MGPVTFSGKPTQPVLFGSADKPVIEAKPAQPEAPIKKQDVIKTKPEPTKPPVFDRRKYQSERMKQYWAERKQREISRSVLPVSR